MSKLGEVIPNSLIYPISYKEGEEIFTTSLDLKKVMLIRHGNKYVFSNEYNEIEDSNDFSELWNMFVSQTVHNFSQMYKALVSDYNLLFNKDVKDVHTVTTTKTGTNNKEETESTTASGSNSESIKDEGSTSNSNTTTYDTTEGTTESQSKNMNDVNANYIEDSKGNKEYSGNKTTNDNRVKRGDEFVTLEVDTKSYSPTKTSHTYESGMNAPDSLIQVGKSVVDAIEENDPEGSKVTTKGGTTATSTDTGGTTRTVTESDSGSASTTKTGTDSISASGTSENERSVSGTSQNTGSRNLTDEGSYSETETVNDTFISQGNQGVTMSQQMVQAELDMRIYNLYNVIVDKFAMNYLIY